jgi:hypothetical protein
VYELVGLLVKPELSFYVGVVMKQARQMFVLLFVHVKNAYVSGDSRLQPYGRKGLQKFKGRNFSSCRMFFLSVLGWGETESTWYISH